jgi:hypothetical protein
MPLRTQAQLPTDSNSEHKHTALVISQKGVGIATLNINKEDILLVHPIVKADYPIVCFQ